MCHKFTNLQQSGASRLRLGQQGNNLLHLADNGASDYNTITDLGKTGYLFSSGDPKAYSDRQVRSPADGRNELIYSTVEARAFPVTPSEDTQ